MRHFFSDLAGETFHNEDASDRQAIIPKCSVGELLDFEHEPDNPADINAIRVRRETGEQIGYLPDTSPPRWSPGRRKDSSTMRPSPGSAALMATARTASR